MIDLILFGDVLTSDLETSTRLAPSAASAVAQASPMPIEAPVRSTTLPCRDMFACVVVCCGYCVFVIFLGLAAYFYGF